MRTRALLAAVGLLLFGGLVVRESVKRRDPVAPLPCPEVAAAVDDRGDRLVCPDDVALRDCSNVRTGIRYWGCRELGQIPGAVLLARGQRLSASQASLDDFTALSGVGPALAARIVEARNHGTFCGIADLERVSGIGPRKAQVISQYLRFDDPRCELPAR